MSASIKFHFNKRERTNVKADQLQNNSVSYTPRLTKLSNMSSQIVHKTMESIQKIQFVQIFISSYFSTSISEDRIIPSNMPSKTEKQVTLMEAYEY